MKKVGFLVFVVALVVGVFLANASSFGRGVGNSFNFSVNFGRVHGSGNVQTEKRDLTGFHGIDAGGFYSIEIFSQREFGVEIETDDNILPLIETEVKNGVLRISHHRKLSPTEAIKIRVYAPDIDKLDLSGITNVVVVDVKNEKLSVESSGATKIKITGQTSKLVVDVSGASKIDAEGLFAHDADIDSSGACIINLNVAGELSADASGASKIYYIGTPTSIKKDISGAGSVAPK